MSDFINYNWMPTIADHCLDAPEEFLGVVTEKLSNRKGRMINMSNPGNGRMFVDFSIPSSITVNEDDGQLEIKFTIEDDDNVWWRWSPTTLQTKWAWHRVHRCYTGYDGWLFFSRVLTWYSYEILVEMQLQE